MHLYMPSNIGDDTEESEEDYIAYNYAVDDGHPVDKYRDANNDEEGDYEDENDLPIADEQRDEQKGNEMPNG